MTERPAPLHNTVVLTNTVLNQSATPAGVSLDEVNTKIVRLIYESSRCQPLSSTDISEKLDLSRQAVHSRLARLVEAGILAIEGSKANTTYCLGGASAAAVIFPGASPEQTVKRLILKHALESQSDPWVRMVKSSLEKERSRPDTYFDIRNIIHPAFSADSDLRITSWSDALFEVFGREPRKEEFTKYLRSFPSMLHWDLSKNCAVSQQHFIDSLVLPELANTPEGRPPNLKYQLVRFRRSRQEDKFLFFSFVAQRVYPGIQCIANDVTREVRDVWRVNEELEKMYGLRPEIRQPLNVIASAQVSLESLARRMENSTGFRQLRDARNALQQLDQSGSGGAAGQILDSAIKESENELSNWRLKLFTVASSLSKVKETFSRIADSLPMPQDSPDQEVPLLEILQREVKSLRERIQNDSEMGNAHLDFTQPIPVDFAKARITGVPYILSEALRALLRNAFNACKYAPDSEVKRIEITASCPARNMVEIRIANTGAMESDRVEYFNRRGESEAPAGAADFGRVSGCVLALKTAKRANGSVTFEVPGDKNETIVTFRAKIASSMILPGQDEASAS